MTVTLLSTIQDPRKTWLATRSLLGGRWHPGGVCHLWGPHLLALAAAHLPLCLQQGERPVGSWLALLWYLLSPLFCEQDWQCLRLELFVGKSSLSLFSSLWLFHSLGFYLMLGPQIVLRAFRPSPYPKHAAHASLFTK